MLILKLHFTLEGFLKASDCFGRQSALCFSSEFKASFKYSYRCFYKHLFLFSFATFRTISVTTCVVIQS